MSVTKNMTTVDWILSTWIIPTMDYKERIYYSCPRVIDDLINKGEIRVNGNIIKTIYHTVYEGDIVYYRGYDYPFGKNDSLCAWLGGKS